MTRAGSGSPRGQQLAGRVAQGMAVPRMSDLHFPVGGSRFRPCLEDILDMLVRELGVDHQPGWRDALADGRERWRRMQTAAVVRDAPGEAIDATARWPHKATATGLVSCETGKYCTDGLATGFEAEPRAVHPCAATGFPATVQEVRRR